MYVKILHYEDVSIKDFVLLIVLLEPISAKPLMEQQKVGCCQCSRWFRAVCETRRNHQKQRFPEHQFGLPGPPPKDGLRLADVFLPTAASA